MLSAVSALAVRLSSGAVGRHRSNAQPAVGSRTRRPLVAVGPFAMLVAIMVGAWTAHLVEYLRVWGSVGYGSAVSRSVHAYMGPVGLAVLLTGAATCSATRWVTVRLERRIVTARASRYTGPARSAPTFVVSLPALLAALWGCQLAVYLTQENLEARAAHLPMPGAAVFSGPHLLAPTVHLIVAAAITGLLYVTRRRVTRLTREWRELVQQLELVAFGPPQPVVATRLRRVWTPAERWGRQSWSRPPPRIAS